MTVDTFSFTRFNQPWTNHSWLSQVILYALYHRAGYTGLSLFMAVSAVLCMALVAMQMPGKPVVRMFLLVLGGIVASVNWVPRPQILSLVLLALTGYFLQRFEDKPDHRIWLLPVIFMVWGNLHGGYILGLLLTGCLLGGSILAQLTGMAGKLNWRDIRRLAFVLVIGYLATAINPNGLNTLLIPFKTVNVAGLHNLISEWASPDFHEPLQQVFLFYTIFLIWLLAFTKKPVRSVSLLTISIFIFLAFTARRNFGPFVIVTLPIMAESITQIEIPSRISVCIQKWRTHSSGKTIPAGLRSILNGMIIGLLVLTAFSKTIYVTQPVLVNEYLHKNYPLNAVEWISEHVAPTRMMNEYDWGGFLIWQLRDFPLFIDGRTDLFGDEIIDEWQQAMQCGSQTEQILQKWDVHLMVVDSNRAVAGCIANTGWQVIYQDEQAAVLTDDSSLVK